MFGLGRAAAVNVEVALALVLVLVLVHVPVALHDGLKGCDPGWRRARVLRRRAEM